MLIEEGKEELSLCRREGSVECVFLLKNLLLRTMDDSHPLAVVCYHIFPVDYSPVEATTAGQQVLYRGHMVGDDDVVAVSGREGVL